MNEGERGGPSAVTSWYPKVEPDQMTDEQRASARRNIEATERARAEDPLIYHVTALDPAQMRYLTPEEREEYYTVRVLGQPTDSFAGFRRTARTPISRLFTES